VKDHRRREVRDARDVSCHVDAREIRAQERVDGRDVVERHEQWLEIFIEQITPLSSEAADPHSPTEALSEQERRILRMFAEGRNSTAIARELEISPQTLRNHLHHINRKLRTHNRLEAVTHAQRRGLID
jgi:DNA-binding CsgD family transcriptional regulator